MVIRGQQEIPLVKTESYSTVQGGGKRRHGWACPGHSRRRGSVCSRGANHRRFAVTDPSKSDLENLNTARGAARAFLEGSARAALARVLEFEMQMQEQLLWKDLTNDEKIEFLRIKARDLRTQPEDEDECILSSQGTAEICDAFAESIDEGYDYDDDVGNMPLVDAAACLITTAIMDTLKKWSTKKLREFYYVTLQRKVRMMEKAFAKGSST